MFKSILIALLFYPSLWAQNQTSMTELPNSMAALGDSMTAGVLTPYPKNEAIFPWHHVRILLNTLDMLATGDREALAFRQNSWSTGDDVNSHYKKLKSLNAHLVSHNFAKPTANSKDIWEKQIPELIQWSQKNLHQDLPDYVTLLIGHIDLCGEELKDLTSEEGFHYNIHRSLRDLLRQNTKTKILVSTIARIDTLPEVMGKSFLLPIPKMFRCEDMWKTIPLCRTVTQRNSLKLKEQVSERRRSFNQILYYEVEKAREVYGDRIRIAEDMESYVPQTSDVAIDCFHANKSAQDKISNRTWKSTWWYNDLNK